MAKTDAEYMADWRARDPERARAAYRKNRRKYVERHPERVSRSKHSDRLKRYGITEDVYEEMLLNQDSVCAICGKVNKSGYRLCVDHDQITGRVRGLLCIKCNVNLGHLERYRQQIDAYLA